MMDRQNLSAPKVSAVAQTLDNEARPFWSVMIPTYNPRADYLEQTLKSVLQQDPGPDQMQIEIVDDCSDDGTAFELTRRVGAGRVTFHRESENRGLANSWNRCIERARGHWVRILHQADIVLPGFYDLLRQAAECSHAGAIFCRHAISNPRGHWIQLSELHLESAGLLDDWHAKITAQQLIQCAAIAVRRSVYEQLGGFLPHLRYVPDWEMWQRIARQFPFCFEPSILACYRLHLNSATSRMRLDAADTREVREMVDLTMTYHTLPVVACLPRRRGRGGQKRLFSMPANCWCKSASPLLGGKLLRPCACVITGASFGGFSHSLSCGSESLDRDLSVG
jgi:hypothetical protein